MEKFIIFCLSTASLSWILCKSKLFTDFRMFITTKFFKLKEKTTSGVEFYFFWYLYNLLGCVGCMGVWSALFNYLVLYKTLSLNIISYSIAGAIISLILNNLISKTHE